MILKLIEKYPNLVILTRTHERAYTLKQQLILSNLNNKILTIHESKGLEFEVVILLGIDKNVMPKLIYYNELELEEERRLMFVGMTRAKSILIVTTLKASIFIKEAKLKPLNKRLIML
jgi:DNA helicase-2/ATP-dependent DNA helicase PcrA